MAFWVHKIVGSRNRQDILSEELWWHAYHQTAAVNIVTDVRRGGGGDRSMLGCSQSHCIVQWLHLRAGWAISMSYRC